MAGLWATRTLAEPLRPEDQGPPPVGPDAYGLTSVIGSHPEIEQVLRDLGEPALLPANATTAGPTFRLLERYSFHKPRSSRLVFDALDGSASAILKEVGQPPAILGLSAPTGIRVRALIDDEERFWNGAPVVPDWAEIAAADRPGMVLVRGDGGLSLLEARVGSKRHAILRANPEDDSLLGHVSGLIFTTRR